MAAFDTEEYSDILFVYGYCDGDAAEARREYQPNRRLPDINSNVDLDCLSNGKKSIALNLKDPQGINIFKRLCEHSDVLIEPFRSGVMESLGLGPEELMKGNNKLIYARLTGYGQKGLYSQRAGHDINYLAMSGLLSLFGRQHDKPMFPVNLAADFGGGGLMCAFGILLALYERTQSGLGQVVDNSMINSTAYLGSWLYRSQKLPIWGRSRGRNVLDGGAHFYDSYETKDGKFLSVGALEPQFYAQFLDALDIDENSMPHFMNFEENQQVLTAKFKEKTLNEWLKVFDGLDACVAPVLTIDEAPKHPHNIENEAFTKTDDGYVPNPSPKLNRTPGVSMATSHPTLCGEHTRSVLRNLNYNEEEIAELEKKGVIQCHKKSHL